MLRSEPLRVIMRILQDQDQPWKQAWHRLGNRAHTNIWYDPLDYEHPAVDWIFCGGRTIGSRTKLHTEVSVYSRCRSSLQDFEGLATIEPSDHNTTCSSKHFQRRQRNARSQISTKFSASGQYSASQALELYLIGSADGMLPDCVKSRSMTGAQPCARTYWGTNDHRTQCSFGEWGYQSWKRHWYEIPDLVAGSEHIRGHYQEQRDHNKVKGHLNKKLEYHVGWGAISSTVPTTIAQESGEIRGAISITCPQWLLKNLVRSWSGIADMNSMPVAARDSRAHKLRLVIAHITTSQKAACVDYHMFGWSRKNWGSFSRRDGLA